MHGLLITLLAVCTATGLRLVEEERVQKLIRDWAPLVWLAPAERFMPLGVPEFLANMQPDDDYLRTRLDVVSLLKNRTSFLYGRKPGESVPIYALVKNCPTTTREETTILTLPGTKIPKLSSRRQEKTVTKETSSLLASKYSKRWNDFPLTISRTKRGQGTRIEPPSRVLDLQDVLERWQLIENGSKREEIEEEKKTKGKEENGPRKLHFHVTYWMFYPFSEGKAVCVLDLGFFGSWPIPTLGGMCLGSLKEYGNHVGDWEHMSLYFKGSEYPTAMYVSAHDAGAFYKFDSSTGSFFYQSQETRKGIFQKPTFPERVFTAADSHPVLFSARGSHGLWTAPGKHKFVRLPRLYDESGFGTAWLTWKNVEVLSNESNGLIPDWMAYTGKWGNPQSNCHPLARLGFNICEFVDGPTGIPTKVPSFRC